MVEYQIIHGKTQYVGWKTVQKWKESLKLSWSYFLLKSSFSNKIIGVLIGGLGSLALPKSIETDFICAGSFSPEVFYFTSIPFFISS